MDIHDVVRSQYDATLTMLAHAIEACPPALWDDSADTNRFWHVAYHALFYLHLYMQPSESEFTPWEHHRRNLNFMGTLPWPPHEQVEPGEPYTPAQLVDYAALIRQQLPGTVDRLDFDGPSGFDWLPMGKLELQFYSIRHVQHHAGELCERLGRAGIDIAWVGLGARSQ